LKTLRTLTFQAPEGKMYLRWVDCDHLLKCLRKEAVADG
jgi:hypothetical protein